MNGYGQRPAYLPGRGVTVGELPGALKEWASTETGTTVVGVITGIAVGEWLGSIVSTYFGMEAGWADVAAKGIGKAILSFAVYFVGRRTQGAVKILLNGLAIGSLASIGGDIIGQLAAPAFGGIFKASSPAIKGITVKANKNPSGNSTPIGGRSQVITSI